ncbi:MAG TPA: O-methyltransferase [Actinocrinis sp.]|uniref:O-methyltransferase n=1 Tax=Actinocrinis sp. TaxID=1920516 RepID=UPI002DDDAC30|nr:O-methyltransferase [Actinocrinis sp.]HEV2344085.1 O-methyltransferase [Actinocrinis sp.]
MSEPTWTAVDEYFNAALIPADPVLDAAVQLSAAEGLPDIAVAPNQGRLLNLIARIHGARRILEVGTLGGYSTIWLARALPADGVLVSLEVNPHHAEVARANLKSAGLAEKAQVRVGRGVDSLAALAEERPAPFDLVFIDADKPSNPEYLAWALRLSRPGTVIVVDNVVRNGAVIDAASTDPTVQGTRRLFDAIAAEPRLDATAIQTTGVKGYDGFVLALVNS